MKGLNVKRKQYFKMYMTKWYANSNSKFKGKMADGDIADNNDM